jgi:phage terminase Nu1 subunit (DNA packaging protein)
MIALTGVARRFPMTDDFLRHVRLTVERVYRDRGILHIETAAQKIASELGAQHRLDEIAEALLSEGIHQHVPVEMDHRQRS